jgi:hypothetical protein
LVCCISENPGVFATVFFPGELQDKLGGGARWTVENVHTSESAVTGPIKNVIMDLLK